MEEEDNGQRGVGSSAFSRSVCISSKTVSLSLSLSLSLTHSHSLSLTLSLSPSLSLSLSLSPSLSLSLSLSVSLSVSLSLSTRADFFLPLRPSLPTPSLPFLSLQCGQAQGQVTSQEVKN
jgi:hypothetical protein